MARERGRKYLPLEAFRHPFCPKMHYKPEVGVVGHPNRRCAECSAEYGRKANRKWRAKMAAGKPPFVQPAGGGFREVRERLGMGRVEFARVLNIDRDRIKRWEEGGMIRRDTVQRVVPIIARLLKEHNERIRQEHEARARREQNANGKRAYYRMGEQVGGVRDAA